MFWYCSRVRLDLNFLPLLFSFYIGDFNANHILWNEQACQIIGWGQNEHQDVCAILKKEPDLKRMFLLDWDTYDTHVQFPLPA